MFFSASVERILTENLKKQDINYKTIILKETFEKFENNKITKEQFKTIVTDVNIMNFYLN